MIKFKFVDTSGAIEIESVSWDHEYYTVFEEECPQGNVTLTTRNGAVHKMDITMLIGASMSVMDIDVGAFWKARELSKE